MNSLTFVSGEFSGDSKAKFVPQYIQRASNMLISYITVEGT